MIEILSAIGWTIFGCVLVVTVGYCAIIINKQESEKEIRVKELQVELEKVRSGSVKYDQD